MAPLPRGKMFDLLMKAQAGFKTAATGDYARTHAYSAAFGESFGLPDDPLLNPPRVNDRDMTDPAPDVHRHTGRLSVPLCIRHIGHWLTGAFGAAVTSAVAAAGAIVFASQPDAGSTITVNGVAFTFVAADPVGDEILIGATLADTIDNIETALNASLDADVAAATYAAAAGTTINVTHDTAGPTGNAFALATSAASHGTASGATLAGGCYSHVFTSGADDLPAFSLEERLRTAATGAAKYRRHLGVMVNSLAFKMQFSEGYGRVDVETVGWKEEAATGASQGGAPTALALSQVPAVKGVLAIADVAVVPLLSLDGTYANNLAPLDYVADEEYVSGFDPGDAAFSGTVRLRDVDETFYDYGRSGGVLDAELRYVVSPAASLTIAAPRMRLQKATRSVNGPGAVEMDFPFRCGQDASGAMLTATLKNDVASY